MVFGDSSIGEIRKIVYCFNEKRGIILICINGIEWSSANRDLQWQAG